MSLYKPKNSPYWHYDFVLKGVRFHGSTGTSDKARARNIEAKARGDAAEGAGGIRKRQQMTLNQAAGRYFEEVAKHQPSHATTDARLAHLVNFFGDDAILSEIDDERVAEYVARRRAVVANASVNRELTIFRAVFRRAERVWKRDIGEMPNWCDHRLPEPAERVRELQLSEESRLFEHLRPDFWPMVEFATLTGIRVGNVIGLTWSQVDFHNREVNLRIKSERPGGESLTVPLTNALMVLLANQRGNHPIFVFTYVCQKSRGKRRKGERYPFSKDGWRKTWKNALAAAGIDNFRFHDTRHTAATRLLRTSDNLKVVQRLLGHKDIRTTARYAHVTNDDVRQAMEQVSRNRPEPGTGLPIKQLTGNGK